MRRLALVGALALLALASLASGQQAMPHLSLRYILTDAPPQDLARARRNCASGSAQKDIDWSRSLGSETLADAADMCPTVLLRLGRDGRLLDLYRDTLTELAGQAAGYEHLPAAIGAAATRGSADVPIGNQRAVVASGALALDAGFTVAFQKREPIRAGMPDLPALRPIASRCLRLQEPSLGLCYATGVVLGSRAINGYSIVAGL